MTTILLVEDNDLNLDMLSCRLRSGGYAIVLEQTAAEAIERTKAGAPDLNLIDFSISATSGLDATREVPAAENGHYIPIFALTAHILSTDREACLEAGCDDFVTNPVDLDRLPRKWRRCLRQNQYG